MKFLTVFVVVAFVALAQALTDEQKEKIKKLHKECIEETHVDEEKVRKALKEGIFEDDAKLKEQFLCFNKKVAIQDDKGKWDLEKVKERLLARVSAEKATEVITKCAVEKSTPQETAFEAAKCFYKEASAHN